MTKILTALLVSVVTLAAAPYPSMAPLDRYLMASRTAEIALARSAAPPAIAKDAEVMVFTRHGYDVAVRGSNGFVCVVERAWANDFNDPGFWNPRLRGPLCFNPAAARSVLPEYLRRTQWVLSGMTRIDMLAQAKRDVASHKITAPEDGSMCYMLSKGGYLGDDAGGPWHPHVMFFLPRIPPAQWGANDPGSPIFAASDSVLPVTIFMVPVKKWSDGTPDATSRM